MRELGYIFIFLSVGTVVLEIVGYQFVILSWLWHWGLKTGIGILLTMFLVGLALYFLGEDDSEPACD